MKCFQTLKRVNVRMTKIVTLNVIQIKNSKGTSVICFKIYYVELK